MKSPAEIHAMAEAVVKAAFDLKVAVDTLDAETGFSEYSELRSILSTNARCSLSEADLLAFMVSRYGESGFLNPDFLSDLDSFGLAPADNS